MFPNDSTQVEKAFENQQQKSALHSDEDGLMNSILENDKDKIKEGELINEAFNHGMESFIPSTIYQNLVDNYSLAKKLYGETFLRDATGYSPDYLSKNIRLPEFQKEIKSILENQAETLKEEGLINKEGEISPEGVDLASFVLYKEELDSLVSKGIYKDSMSEEKSRYGEKKELHNYKKGDRYQDIDIRKSLKVAMRRAHPDVHIKDLRVRNRESQDSVSIIYALDSSSSMRGKKLGLCKKAGLSLAFKAIQNKDKVGLVVFGSEIKEKAEPSKDFMTLLKKIVKIKASGQTNISETIKESITLYRAGKNKHLILLTDALPTKGKQPEKDTLEAVSLAKANKITISVVGLGLDKRGEEFAKKIVQMGGGRVYNMKELEELDKIVLEEYYTLRR